MKLAVDSLRGVSETLLIPLHYRVEESRRSGGSFRDTIAEAFHDAIAYEWQKFRGASLQGPTTVTRTLVLDNAVRRFLVEHREGLVVNLGAGLDTRFHRLDNGHLGWVDIDLPEVIAFRRRLPEPASDRHMLFAGSVLERSWIDAVSSNRRGRVVLLVAEGLFPYFNEAEHRKLFEYLAQSFRGDDLFFQTSAPSIVRGFVASSDLSKLRTSAQLQWGLEEGRDVEALCPGVHFLGETSLLELCRDHIPPELAVRLTRDDLRRAAKIVHVRFV